MKKIIIIIVILIILGIISFLYFTRKVKATKVNIKNEVKPLTVTNGKVLSIDASSSEAQFSLHEVLDGKPNLVVGKSSAVAGQVAVNLDPAKLTIGEVKVDAQTLKTDNDRRNNTIARFILDSVDEANRFITFEPTQVTGLPEKLTVGQSFNYSITGNLTVKGVTKPVTFQAESTVNADGSLSGSASTTVTYEDFGAEVPSLPFLADVDKTTVLSINFVAK